MSANRLKLNTDKIAALDWVETQHISTRWLWSIYTTGCRYCPSSWPCAVAWSNYLGWPEPRPPCVCHQFSILLLAVTASTSSPITRQWIGSHTSSCLYYVQGRLLQSAVGRSTKVCYRQVAAGYERCSASCERHEEVRPWLDTPASLWATLGQCGRSSHIQAWGDGVQVLGWPGAKLSVKSCVHRSLKLLKDSIFVLPAAIFSSFHGFSSIPTAVAPSLSLDQRHGTCSETTCMTRTCKLTIFVVHWRRFLLNSTRHIEHITGVIATMCYINWTFTFAPGKVAFKTREREMRPTQVHYLSATRCAGSAWQH